MFTEFLCALGEEDVGKRFERREPEAQFEIDVRLRQPNREGVVVDDLDAAGSMQAAKAAGKVRMEGKDYVMADGDVVEFRFNV